MKTVVPTMCVAHRQNRSDIAVILSTRPLTVEGTRWTGGAPLHPSGCLKARGTVDPFLGTGDVGSALDAVGAALGLDKLVLAGSIKGQVLTFE